MWERIAGVLDALGVKPIMAVVPDNQDPDLRFGPARADFWEQVRQWQAKGWFIALHGYQHRYVTREAGLVGINRFSEFAGLPHEEQRQKLVEALRIFEHHGVRADGWVAPGHSFDVHTLRALREMGIEVISDGFFRRPVRHLGATWLPQQLWRFRPMPAGVWTVCLHHNGLTDQGFEALKENLARYAGAITTATAVLREGPIMASGALDLALMHAWRAALRLKRQVA
jgi:hypothetical protein